MVGRTHRIGGILFGAGASICAVPMFHITGIIPFAGAMMAGGAVGSLIPDIDKKGTTASKALGPVSNVINKKMHHRGITHSLVAWVVYLLAALAIAKVMQHVGNTESTEIVKSLIEAFITGSSISFCLHVLNRKIKLFRRDRMFIVIAVVYILAFAFSLTSQGTAIRYFQFYMYGSIIGYFSHLVLDIFNKAGIPVFKPLINTKFHFANVITGTGAETVIARVMMVLVVLCVIQLLSMSFGASLLSLI